MKIGPCACWAALLLVTTLVAGCAVPADTRNPPPAAPDSSDAILEKVPAYAHGLIDLPPAEQRRGLDVVLASHPDDLLARFLRVDTDRRLEDYPAVLADSEAVLANPALNRPSRRLVLVARSEALMQVRRPADAALAADEAVQIDGSLPDGLFARGWAHYLADHGQAESALADLNRALERQPDNGVGHYRRAVVARHLDKFDLAAADLEQAARLMPGDAATRLQRTGLLFAEWYSGRSRQPIAVFREQATRPVADPYAPLWLFVMRIRADPADEAAAKTELATLAPAHHPHAWTDTLDDVMLDKSTLDAALAEADTAPTNELRAGRRCEADYYVAEQLLAHRQDMAAGRLLEEAYWLCPSTYVEAEAVVAERRRLEAGSPVR